MKAGGAPPATLGLAAFTFAAKLRSMKAGGAPPATPSGYPTNIRRGWSLNEGGGRTPRNAGTSGDIILVDWIAQ